MYVCKKILFTPLRPPFLACTSAFQHPKLSEQPEQFQPRPHF